MGRLADKWTAALVELLPADAPVQFTAAATGMGDAFLREQFGGAAPTTLRKHWSNVREYINFVSLLEKDPWPADVALLWQFLEQMVKDGATKGRPRGMLASIGWFARRAELVSAHAVPALQTKVMNYQANFSKDLVEAVPFPVAAVQLIEWSILDASFPVVLRIVLWFCRLGIGSSTRFGDRQKCRPDALQLLSSGDLVGRSWGGKTGARFFACAAAGCQVLPDQPDSGAWLAVGYSLFLNHACLQFPRDYLLPVLHCQEGGSGDLRPEARDDRQLRGRCAPCHGRGGHSSEGGPRDDAALGESHHDPLGCPPQRGH